MRILHVDLGTEWRGGQQQALLLMQGLAAKGHEQRLAAPASSPLCERTQAAGFEVTAVAPRTRRLRGAAIIHQLLHRERFDVIHLHEAHAHTAAWLARPPQSVARVVARRVAYPARRDPITQAKYRRGADRFIAVSEFVRESLIASGVPSEKVDVVYDGIEIPDLPRPEERLRARTRFDFEDQAIVLGCVGYLLPEKGQDKLVEAMAQVAPEFPPAHLLLAGEGPLRERILGLVQKLRLAGRVKLTGFLADVAEIYRAMDIFVFPSLAEPLGSSLLTAMAYGLPAIAVNAGAVPEVIEAERTGLLVAAADPALLADAMRRLIGNRPRWSRLGEAARASVQARFTAAIMVARTEGVYRRVLEGK